MKKNNEKNPSKNVGNMMRKLEKQDLEQTTGGTVIGPGGCRTCGLLVTGI
jgi:hypothetical protein